MPDAWRAYLELALGLTEAPRKKAEAAARKAVGELVSKGGATAAQLQGLVEDLLSAGMANREAVTNIVRFEVDKALGAVGLATADEVGELTARVRDLEKQLKEAEARAEAAEGSAVPSGGAVSGGETGGTRLEQPAPLPRKVAKKAVATKAVKAPPNAMPTAGTKPASPAGNTGRGTAEPAPAQPAPTAQPAKKAASARKAAPPVKAAPRKRATKAVEPTAPAGTAESPVAAVKEAAAATELPPVKAPAKRAPAKTTSARTTPAKAAPVTTPAKKTAAQTTPVKTTPVTTPAKKAAAKKTTAKKTSPRKPEA